MPIYEYQCNACTHEFEVLQKITETSLPECPQCGNTKTKRLVSAPSFKLTGTGWYETDFKNKQQPKKPEANQAKAEPNKSESSSAGSTESTASDSAAPAKTTTPSQGAASDV